VDLLFNRRELVEDFGGDFGNELSEITVNETNIDFSEE